MKYTVQKFLVKDNTKAKVLQNFKLNQINKLNSRFLLILLCQGTESTNMC